MKHILTITLFLLISISSKSTFAQQTGNAVIIQNLEADFPEDGTAAEFDSLTHLFQTKVWDKNPYVISHKTIRHWWGDNNRDILEITEIKTWEDIPKAMQKLEELFKESWTTKEDREKFNKAYNKYFTGKHSDEIYREVKFSK
ncbi:MAG: hypothetical protein IPH62_07560 [Ignavibacteriae bacterium]|nr:hypothetical protein [Ignavibacteriota bacterium]